MGLACVRVKKTYSSRRPLMFPSDKGISPVNWLSSKCLSDMKTMPCKVMFILYLSKNILYLKKKNKTQTNLQTSCTQTVPQIFPHTLACYYTSKLLRVYKASHHIVSSRDNWFISEQTGHRYHSNGDQSISTPFPCATKHPKLGQMGKKTGEGKRTILQCLQHL